MFSLWRNSIAFLILGKLLLLFALTALAAPENGKTNASPPPPAAAKNTPVYKPPMRGAPSSRVGGGTRGGATGSVMLTVLAPDHTGWSSKDQPTLYWYVSKPLNTHVELAVIDEVSIKPLLETNVAIPSRAGIQSLRLAEHGVHLRPGVEYQWSVALVTDKEQRSNDVVSSGTITYVEPPADLQKTLAQANPETLPFVYAEAGYWYDAMENLSRLIEVRPNNRRFREQRASLLEQVVLPEAAEYDRR